jgi:exosortase A-associated hydrolase 1
MSAPHEQAIVFICGADELLGILHHAADPHPACGVVIVVGGPQYRVGSHRQFILMARALAAAGIPVLRFDYRGMGDSEGAARSFESVGEDITAAIDALTRAIPSVRKIALWGLCDAASAALMVVPAEARVSALILANPWVRTQSGEARAYVSHYYGDRLLQRDFWTKLLRGKVNPFSALAGWFRMHRVARTAPTAAALGFIERMRMGMEAFSGPVLLLLSERDLTAQEFVDHCAASREWSRLLTRPNVIVERLAGADHTFSQRPVLQRATEHSRLFLAGLTRTAAG